LHTAFHTQNSGKVEYMNRTLKPQLLILCQWKPSSVGPITAHSIAKD
jgi:hypothetical protein